MSVCLCGFRLDPPTLSLRSPLANLLRGRTMSDVASKKRCFETLDKPASGSQDEYGEASESKPSSAMEQITDLIKLRKTADVT